MARGTRDSSLAEDHREKDVFGGLTSKEPAGKVSNEERRGKKAPFGNSHQELAEYLTLS